MAGPIKNFVTSAEHQTARGGVTAASSVAKHTLKLFGLPIAAVLVAGMDLWDYMLQRNRLVDQYANEVGAKLGIEPEKVTAKDFALVAKENPTLKEAANRLRRERNMQMVTNVATVAATFAIGISLFSGATIPVILVGIGGFIASKLVADVIGRRVLGLHEPSLKKVKKDPALQDKLSLPSQVTYIESLQTSGKKIEPKHIEKLFAKAGNTITPEKAAEVSSNLNQHIIDATELAFMVDGQRSGKPEIHDRELTRKDKIINDLQARVAVAEQKLNDASAVAKERTNTEVEGVKDKAIDIVDNIKDKASEVSTKWRDKHPSRAGQSATDAVQQSRQQAANTGISV